MHIMKKIGLIVLLLFSPFIFLANAWTIILGGMYVFTPAPPKPQIQAGEFPFTLTYKLNNELYTVEDIYICNYDGVGFDEGNGKHRKWSGHIKGSGASSIFITEDSDRQIFCFVGDAEFYMGDEKYPEQRPLTPRLYDVTKNSNVDSLHRDEIAKFYNIEIVSWSFSEPIENSFGYTYVTVGIPRYCGIFSTIQQLFFFFIT